MAGEEFLVLVRDDPDTPHFPCIPLAWVPAQPSTLVQQAARRWIAKDDMPAAVLLGASHLLLTGDSHDAAMSYLAGLMAAKDPRIVQLVKAQMWRPMVAQAGERELAAWQAAIERMPESLRAGPYYVLGRGWFQRQDWEQAALAFMRIPILYPEHRMTAARSLMDAGWSLEKLDRTSQAARVYRELIQEYPGGREAAQAQGRLEELASNGEP
jgi:tetratricopeptide (TPR) repeat protein